MSLHACLTARSLEETSSDGEAMTTASSSARVPIHRLLWSCGTLVLGAAAFICSLVALQLKLLSQPVPATQVTLLSSAFGLAVTSCALLLDWQRRRWWAAHRSGASTGASITFTQLPSSRKLLLLVLLRCVLGALAVTAFYVAVELLPLHTAITLFFLSPAFAVLLEALVRRRAVTAFALVGCTLAVAGVVLIGRKGPCGLHNLPWSAPGGHGRPFVSSQSFHVQPSEFALHSSSSSSSSSNSAGSSFRSSSNGGSRSVSGMDDMSTAGVALGIAAALANAASFVTLAEVGTAVSSLTITWWYHCIVVVISLFSCAFSPPGVPGFWMASEHDVWLLAGIAVANLLGQLLLNRGFQLESASRGSAINTSQVLYSYIWEILLLKGAATTCALMGSSAIVAGVLCVGYDGSGNSSSSGDPDLQRAQQSVQWRMGKQAEDDLQQLHQAELHHLQQQQQQQQQQRQQQQRQHQRQRSDDSQVSVDMEACIQENLEAPLLQSRANAKEQERSSSP